MASSDSPKVKSLHRRVWSSFYDHSFPHTKQSLHNPSLDSTKADVLQICERAVWKKAGDFFPNSRFFLFTFIHPIAVRQGTLADCYFLSSLCSLAKFPSRIQRLFAESPSEESYTVSVYMNGVNKKIVVDNFFVYDPLISDSPFSKPYMSQIWVQVLEKAWAKVNGSFTNLEFGEEIEALEFLTGAPVDCYIHYSPKTSSEQLWAKICFACLKNYVVACSTKKEKPDNSVKKSGLMPFHVYSLLYAKEFRGGKKVLLLRDPWHKTLWKGSLPKEVKSEFGEIDDSDCFAITLEEYLQYFKETTVCKYEDNFVHSTVVVSNTEFASYTFEIKDNMKKGYISIHQDHYRLHRLEDKAYTYSPIYLILGKISGGRVWYVTSLVTTVLNTEHRKVKLSPGKYVVFTGAAWSKRCMQKYTVHLYAEEQTEFHETLYDPKMLVEVAKSYAQMNKRSWKKFGEGMYHFDKIDYDLGFGIRFVKNASEEQVTYEDSMVHSGLIQIWPKEEGTKELESGEESVVLYKFSSTRSYTYDFKYKQVTAEDI